MKTVSFLSVAFMAVSAIAAPLGGVDTSLVDSTVKDVTNVAGGVVGGAVGSVSQDGRKRDMTDAAGLLSSLQGVQSNLGGPLGNLKDITEGVRAGEITKQEATKQAAPQLKEVETILSGLTSELTGASGLNVANIDVTGVTSVVNVVVAEVLVTVSDLVGVLGIRAPLVSILTSVVALVGKVLTLVVGLVSELVPGIIAGLTPLLAGIGSGVLAPVLTPVASVVSSL